MENLNKETVYAVIEDLEENVYHIIKDKSIDRYVNLFEQPGYSHYAAGDYSLYNSESCAEEDMKEDGVKLFGESFRNISYLSAGQDESLILDNWSEDLDGRAEEIESFLNAWEEEHASYCKVDAYSFWNGSENQTIVIRYYDADFEGGFRELDKEDAAPILNAMEEVDEFVGTGVGYEEARWGGYVFEDSQWEKDWGLLVRKE